ncbi:MAG: hypothetical protein ACUVTB_07680, partial [Candidatus Bathycorpusculaceae bacterium]
IARLPGGESLGKGKVIILPRHPSPDKIITAALLINAGKASEVKVIAMIPHERWRLPIKNAIPVGCDVNYKKINWRSYTEAILSEYNIERTPEIQRLVELANKNVQHRSEKGSFNDLFNAVYSAQYWTAQRGGDGFSDEQIVQEGIECIRDLVYFAKQGFKRDDEWVWRIIKKETRLQGLEKVPHRLYKYLKGEKVECDIGQILVGRRARKSETEAQELASKVVKIYHLSYLTFGEALRIVKDKSIFKQIGKNRIVASRTDNPVFVGAAQGAVTIQQLSTGHVQIFFAPYVPKEVSDDLTALLRGEELKLSKRDEFSLAKERESPEVPKWFYVKSPYGPRMVLNGSTRIDESISPPTRISLLDIVKFAELTLRANM